eukprot:6179223-Pleurochrysis_carterae.AAC.5
MNHIIIIDTFDTTGRCHRSPWSLIITPAKWQSEAGLEQGGWHSSIKYVNRNQANGGSCNESKTPPNFTVRLLPKSALASDPDSSNNN